jgi:hypothetical protein
MARRCVLHAHANLVNNNSNLIKLIEFRMTPLGLPHTGPTNGVAAYLATAATAHRAMHSCPNTFRPCDGPSGAVLSLQWMALHDGAGPLWRPKLCGVGPSSMGTIAGAQIAISRHSAQIHANVLIDSYDGGPELGKRDRALLLSYACHPASAWLITLPIWRAFKLNCGRDQTDLRHCLNLTVLPQNAPIVQSSCRAPLPRTDFDHGMRCPALAAQLSCAMTF